MVYKPVEAAKVRATFNREVLRPLGIHEGSLVTCVDGAGIFQGIHLTRDDDPSVIILLAQEGQKGGTYKNLSSVRDFQYKGRAIQVRSQMHVPSPEEQERIATAEREREEERSLRRSRLY